MNKFTGTVQTTADLPTVAGPITTPAIPTTPKTSISDILQSIKKSDGTPLVNYNQALALTSLRFTSGEPVLSLTDRYFVFEVTNLLNQLDYEVVYNYLSANWEEVFGSGPRLRKNILFMNPLMDPAREKMALDMEIYRNRIEVAKGAVDCPKCGSDETISIERQIRSGDEGASIFCSCVQCRHRWRAQ